MDNSVIFLKSRLAQGGGAEKYAQRLAQAFQKKGNQVTLLTSGKQPLVAQGIEVAVCPKASRLSFLSVHQFDRFCADYIARRPARIIFGLDRNRFQTHLRASNGVHAAYLQQRRTTDPLWKRLSHAVNPLHRTLLQIEKESFEHPALEVLFTNSEMVKQEILHFYRTDPKKIQVVHNGVEWQEMASDFAAWPEEKKNFAQRLGLNPDVYHFLFVGHNYQRKGLELLLRGLSLIPHRAFHLSVVGKEKNLGYFQALARSLSLENAVSFFGSRSDIRSFYQLADCLVIPSFYDPFANVTVEALAMGLFVVSSKSNGGSEVLTPESGAVIAELTDPGALCEALECALKHPKTAASSEQIRKAIAPLDFSTQLHSFVKACCP